jgi:hypothetical protein
VVRPVIFLAYSGEMRWRTRAGDEITGTLGTPMLPDQLAHAWRTALDPQGEWVQRVMEAADRRLTEVRRGMPDAAGLVIAGDHADARAYAALLRRISGTRPVVVLSDDPTASRKIAAFTDSGDRWMVAVRMVSEGVDIPRLAVGVYATSVGTALFFAQAVGRFVRARQRGETASVFLPSIPTLLGYAAELEAARDHVLAAQPGDAEERELAEAQRRRDTPDTDGELPFEALQASAHFDRVLYDGTEFGTSAAEEDFLGLPGLLDPEQVALLLRKRQNEQLRQRSRGSGAGGGGPQPPGPGRSVPAWAASVADHGAPAAADGAAAGGTAGTGAAAPVRREVLAGLRKELNGLIGAWHHRTGQPHAVVHADLRRACGGPPLPQATAEQIQERIDTIRRWARSGR